MLGDPLGARFITTDRKPVTEPMAGWRNSAIMAGHWVLHGFGMFAAEEKSLGKFAGRVGSFFLPVWPGFEVGWGIAREFRGKGNAVEAAPAAIDWSFATFELERIVDCIDRENTASQAVVRRLGASNEGEPDLARGSTGKCCTSSVNRSEKPHVATRTNAASCCRAMVP